MVTATNPTGKPLTTLNDIVATWAPPSTPQNPHENDTPLLIKRASEWMGVAPDQPLDLKDPKVMAKLVEATIRNEQGGNLPVDPSVISKVTGAVDWYAPPLKTEAGHWKVAPSAISSEQSRRDASVVFMPPDEYLSLMPRADGDAAQQRKRTSLDRSLASGDEIESIPTLDVRNEKGKLRVTDQDGRSRAQAALDAGVDLIPVSVRGAPSKFTDESGTVGSSRYSGIVGLNGVERPFDFAAVPDAKKEPPTKPTPGWLATMERASPVIGGAAAGVVRELSGDKPQNLPEAVGATVAQVGRGLVEPVVSGAVEGGQRAMGVGEAGQDPLRQVSPNILASTMALGGVRAPAELGPQTVAPGGRLSPPPPAQTNALATQARDMVNQRVNQSVEGGGPVHEDIVNALRQAHNAGQPMTLADLVKPVRDLLGNVYREPGPARTIVKKTLEARDAAAPVRAEEAIAKYMGTGTLKETQDALIAARSKAGKTLWDKALEGGSIAPLEQQFGKVLDEASKVATEAERSVRTAEARVTQAAARQSTADNVYSSAASNRAQTFANDQLRDAKRALADTQVIKDRALQRLRAAQADGTANAPGAVWSPRLQQFLDEPLIKAGLQRGREIERLDALSEARPVHLDEYAVVGVDPNGDWKIGAVPTFRLLKVAKQGLDSMVEAERVPLTGRLNERGVAIDKVRRQYLAELDRLNPDYKPARDAWSGATSSIAALQYGRDIFKRGAGHYAEDVVQRAAEMTPNEKEFAKVGIAAKMREDVLNVADAGDESKALANSRGARERLRPFFDSQEAAGNFLDFVDRERQMFQTNQNVMGGPLTAERLAEDRSKVSGGMHIAQAGAHALAHNPLGVVRSLLRAKTELGATSSPELNAQIAKTILHYAIPDAQRGGANLLATAAQRLPKLRNYLSGVGQRTAPATPAMMGNSLQQLQQQPMQFQAPQNFQRPQ